MKKFILLFVITFFSCDNMKKNKQDIENVAYFYDLNTKSNFVINDKNKIFISGYFGRDVFKLQDTFSNTYGNSTFNFRWNYLINEKTFSNTSVLYSVLRIQF